ncbi:MAG: hypothetical protein HON90_15715 [Halobacteriovoraceae bacterium]|jgi:hypothetical protein|nr:hypothetical protein [Halobacteriovoraceae bacterium]
MKNLVFGTIALISMSAFAKNCIYNDITFSGDGIGLSEVEALIVKELKVKGYIHKKKYDLEKYRGVMRFTSNENQPFVIGTKIATVDVTLDETDHYYQVQTMSTDSIDKKINQYLKDSINGLQKRDFLNINFRVGEAIVNGFNDEVFVFKGYAPRLSFGEGYTKISDNDWNTLETESPHFFNISSVSERTEFAKRVLKQIPKCL